jgi:hypothetical protein
LRLLLCDLPVEVLSEHVFINELLDRHLLSVLIKPSYP